MIQLNNEEDFKSIPRLRWHIDVDGTPIATTIKKRLQKDHLYFHGPSKLAIYYERDTEKKATYARKYWNDRCKGVYEMQYGEYDGIILFKPVDIEDIPDDFIKSDARISNLPDVNEHQNQIKASQNELSGSDFDFGRPE